MRAHVGDCLVVAAGRIGLVIGIPAEDGTPPYIVKWLRDGHIAMVQPDQYSRIVPREELTGLPEGGDRARPGDRPRDARVPGRSLDKESDGRPGRS